MRHLTHEQIRAHWRVIPIVYLASAVLLIPWTTYLAFTLPRAAVADHYRLAWVGFDVLLIVCLFRVGYFAWRRDPRVVLVAIVAATLLTVDGWFDIMTSADGEAGPAVVTALCIEFPGAAICSVLARRGLRELLRRAAMGQHPAAGSR